MRTNRVDVQGNPRLKGVGSGLLGAFERSTRFPTCRLTAFSMQKPEIFRQAMPFIRSVDSVFARELPDRYQAQMEWVKATEPDWIIHGTSFSTVTVNKNFRTALHTDRGDLAAGFGVLSVLRAGDYSGCYTVFPEFGVGIDMHTGGVLLADVHRWHANTPLVGDPGRYERIASVFYYREKMVACKDSETEVKIAAAREPGDPIWPKGAFEDERKNG